MWNHRGLVPREETEREWGGFGFVRYGNVRDVDKLLKALNNVWFGDCRVVAKVASFDRLGNKNQGVGVKGDGVNRKAIGIGGVGINRCWSKP